MVPKPRIVSRSIWSTNSTRAAERPQFFYHSATSSTSATKSASTNPSSTSRICYATPILAIAGNHDAQNIKHTDPNSEAVTGSCSKATMDLSTTRPLTRSQAPSGARVGQGGPQHVAGALAGGAAPLKSHPAGGASARRRSRVGRPRTHAPRARVAIHRPERPFPLGVECLSDSEGVTARGEVLMSNIATSSTLPTLLIVDDNRPFCEIVRLSLLSVGFRVGVDVPPL